MEEKRVGSLLHTNDIFAVQEIIGGFYDYVVNFFDLLRADAFMVVGEFHGNARAEYRQRPF